MTQSPQTRRSDALAIAMAGIEAADAGRLVERALSVSEGSLAGLAENRNERRRLHVLAAGKAARAMAGSAERALATRIRSGLIVAPSDARSVRLQPDPSTPFESIAGGHPLPTAESERAGRRALTLAASVPPEDTLLVLLSGGASALLAVPADGITLDDKHRVTERLLLAGADIHSLNVVRKHLSAIKGGWLAVAARCPCRTLVISDVVGDDLSVIASGPTVADATTFADAFEVLHTHGGLNAYPPPVVARLRAGARGEIAETPKPGDAGLKSSAAAVIGGRLDAMDGAAHEAEARGYRVIRVDAPIVGEARRAAEAFVRVLFAREDVGRPLTGRHPLCIVSSGETIVRVTGKGKGGRNQEFALAAAGSLAEVYGRRADPVGSAAVLVSIGTDGVDGPTDAAGALVDMTTLQRAKAAGLDPMAALDANDAYTFFDRLGDLIRIGPTATNVGDLQVVLVA